MPAPDNRSMPPGAIIPELVYPDLDSAVEWLCRVFGFTERLRIGGHRAQLTFMDGDGAQVSIVVVQQPKVARPVAPTGLVQLGAPTLPAQPTHSLMLRVAGVEAHYQRARQAGARIVQPPTDYPYGERQYTAEDPTGRRWTFTQTLADVDPAAWGGRLVE